MTTEATIVHAASTSQPLMVIYDAPTRPFGRLVKCLRYVKVLAVADGRVTLDDFECWWKRRRDVAIEEIETAVFV